MDLTSNISARPQGWRILAGNTVKGASVVWLVFEITGGIWNGISLEMPLPVALMSVVAFAFGGGLFIANLVMAGLIRERRRLHGVLCLSFLTAWGLSLWMSDMHMKRRHQWFFKEGTGNYSEIVQRIVETRVLTSESESPRLAGVANQIRAYTNVDGSMTVWFPDGARGLRHGFLYHSGALLTNKPGNNPGDYFFHLTNGWYEY